MSYRKAPNSLLILLAIVAATLAGAQAPALAITGVNVVDVIAGRIVANRTVIVTGATVSSVAENVPPPGGARIIDGRGKFLIPGLWDMHAHHQLTGEASLPLFVATGVTGTRDMGADLDFIMPLRAKTASGAVLGPRIVAAGPILDNRPAEWPFRLTVRNTDEATRAVQLLKQRGVDFVKVHDGTPSDAYTAIIEEARRLNLAVAGHLPRGITIEQAAAAGQRSLEHLASFRLYAQCSGGRGYAAEQCRAFLKWLATTGMWQTPTLVNWRQMFTLGTPAGNAEQDHFAYASPGVREFLAMNQKMSKVTPQGVRDMLDAADTAAIAVNDMQKAGVGLLAGCDGMIAGFCLHEELRLMVRGGMSAAAALQTATINPARYLELQATLGSVGPGKRADLVLLDASPLDDITNVSRIRSVIVGGRVLDRAALDRMLADVRRQFQRLSADPPGR